MTDETNDTPKHPLADLTDKDGRPLVRTSEVAEGPNPDANADQAKAAHEASSGDAFITHEDGSKSVRFADTPQRREED